MRHVLNAEEREQLMRRERESYEVSEKQVLLQMRDAQKWARHEKVSGRNADQFVRQQRHKRWNRHLQRLCGTKELYEVLTTYGDFTIFATSRRQRPHVD